MEPSKLCRRCNTGKPHAAFCRDPKAKDGLRSYCRECATAYYRQWAAKHPDKVRQYQDHFRRKHPTYHRDYYLRMRDAARNLRTASE